MIKLEKNLTLKIILALLGVFIVSMIFAIGIEIFEETGIWIGIILLLGIVALGFYYTKKGDKIRVLVWSILITLLASIALFITVLQLISKSLEGF